MSESSVGSCTKQRLGGVACGNGGVGFATVSRIFNKPASRSVLGVAGTGQTLLFVFPNRVSAADASFLVAKIA